MTSANRGGGRISSRSLVTQISWLVLGGLVFTVVVATGIYALVAADRLQVEVDRRHQLLSDNLAVVIETAWRQDNYPLIVQVVDSLLSDGDVHLARVVESSGRVLVSSDVNQTGTLLTDLEATQPDMRVAIADFGYLEVFVGHDRLSSFLQGFLLRGGAAALLATLVVCVVVRQRLKNATRDLEQTVAAAEMMRAGEFDLGLESSRHREIESLRQSLNETARRLEALTGDLRHQVAKAEAASESKGQFLANMSHEIRTPLNGMIGMIDLIDEDNMSPVQIEYLDTLRSSSRALLALLNDILDFSRIEANQLDVAVVDVDVVAVVEEVVALMTPLAESKGLRIQHGFGSEMPRSVTADPGRLRQVLSNVVGNAVKFTEEGWVEVRIDQHKGLCSIRVTDTGIGVPSGNRESIFHSFEQVDATSQRQHGGTGLGLSISRGLARMMGGDIELSDRVGGGSVFTLTVPMPDGGESPQEEPLFAGLTIGCCEGDHPLDTVMCDSLRALGATLHPLATPSECGDRAFDAILVLDSQAAHDPDWQRIDARICYCGPRVDDLKTLPDYVQPVYCPFHWHRLAAVCRGVVAEQAPTPRPTASQPAPVIIDAQQSVQALVVEDNIVNQRVVMTLLSKIGCQVDVVENGQCALEYLEANHQPDVIFMDCQMPVLDGYAATRVIREREAEQGSQRALIVALTANAMMGDRERCLTAGMDDHVAKPVSLAELREVLARHGVLNHTVSKPV